MEGTLGHWIAYRILTCLESGVEDTVGILAAIEDVKLHRPSSGKQAGFDPSGLKSSSGSLRPNGMLPVCKRPTLLRKVRSTEQAFKVHRAVHGRGQQHRLPEAIRVALLRWPGATSKPDSSTHIWIRAKALLSLGFASKDGNLPLAMCTLSRVLAPVLVSTQAFWQRSSCSFRS